MVLNGGRSYAPLGASKQSSISGDIELTTAYDSRDVPPGHSSSTQTFRFKNSLPDASVSETSSRVDTLWNPLFLRRWVLFTFALFFAAVIAALQVLYSVSLNNHGIASSDGGKHYLWTYGPTALFIIVTVLWRQVDYATKSIQPWAEMAKGPQPAVNSLLLDYVTPLQIFAFWDSVRRRHFNVSSTILVFFLIKVITVASTGIFSLQNVIQSDVSTAMVLNNTFDASAFQHAASVDSRPAFIVYGRREYNNSLPHGTTDFYAVQSFASQGGPINGSLAYNATVDVFRASLECESGDLTYTAGRDPAAMAPLSLYYNTSISLPDCEIVDAYLDAPDWFYGTNDTAARFGYRGTFQNATCLNLPEEDPTRDRVLIAFAYSEGNGQNDHTMINSSHVVCIPRYTVEPASVLLETSGKVLSIVPSGTSRQISGFTGSDLGLGVLQSIREAYTLASSSSEGKLDLDVFTRLMLQDTPDYVEANLLDSQFLNTTADRTFSKLAAQVANMYLLVPTSTNPQPTVVGSISKNTNRLVVQQTPVRVMQGLAAVMLILSLVMAFATPRGVVPRSIDSIVAIAAILARSKKLEERLRDTGHMDMNELAILLSPYYFWTRIDHENTVRTFSIQMASKHENDRRVDAASLDSRLHKIKWIRPFVLRRIAIIIIILLSIAAIITLEVLLSKSQANNGLANVRNDAATRYSWLYVPMIVFLLLGTLFNIMDFEIEFNESYHALARGFCDARSSMLWYPLNHISLSAAWNGLRHSRYALAASSASAVLAPLLTIVVAGLFFTRATLRSSPITVNALDWFNTTGSTLASNPEPPSLIIQGNMSYPSFTFDELAFPRLAAMGDYTGNGSILVNTPALRAAVVCSAVPTSQFVNVSLEDSSLVSNISTPDGCGNSGFVDGPNLFLSTSHQIPVNTSGYFGSDLPLGFEDNCPTVVLYYGHVTDQELDNFTAVLCTQSIERVETALELTFPDLEINKPADIQADSAVNFSSWYESFPTFQPINITNTNDVFDDMFNAMIYGRDGVPQAELLTPSRLIEAYTHLYRQYVAQVLNLQFRAGFSDIPANQTDVVVNPLQGTLNELNQFRLIQSPLSTHLLAGVLAVLLLCALIILITIDMRRVLPKQVGSIAAVASLLAGGTLVDERSGLIPKGSEFWSDKHWEESGIWQGQMFRMGYWNNVHEPIGLRQTSGVPLRFGGSEVSGAQPSSIEERSFRIDATQMTVA